MSRKIFKLNGEGVFKRLGIALKLKKTDNATLAKILEKSPGAITNYRRNYRALPLDKLYELSELYRFSLDWLLSGKTKQQIVKVIISRDGTVKSSIEWIPVDEE